jgi:hypothetical protein
MIEQQNSQASNVEPWFTPSLQLGHEIVGTIVGHGFIHFAEGRGQTRYYRLKSEGVAIAHTHSELIVVTDGDIVRVPISKDTAAILEIGTRVKVSVQKKVRKPPIMGRSALFCMANVSVVGNA